MEQEISLTWIVGAIIVLFIAGFFLFGLWYLIPVLIGAGIIEYFEKKKKPLNKTIKIILWVLIVLGILIAVYFDLKTLI